MQKQITLAPRPRGFHLITDEVTAGFPEIGQIRVGIALVFMQHTSASLTVNENASPAVRDDFRSWVDDAVPENAPYWTHTLEGADDMPAHIKSMLTATSLGVPVAAGRTVLGTWQAIYLVEHRDKPHTREIALHYIGTLSSSIPVR